MFNDGLLKVRPEGGYDVVDDPNERKQLQELNAHMSKSKFESHIDSASQISESFNNPILQDGEKDGGGMMQS